MLRLSLLKVASHAGGKSPVVSEEVNIQKVLKSDDYRVSYIALQVPWGVLGHKPPHTPSTLLL